MANKKYEVVHRSLYLRVNDKLQHVAKGTLISLDPTQVKKMLSSGKIRDLSDKKVINLTKDKKKDDKPEESKNVLLKDDKLSK